MKHLALYLRAPLQSWGASSKFGDRGTLDAPTRSGLLGLLAAACGVDKNDETRDREWLARAAKLSVAVLAFRRGDRMPDYHTVGARYDRDDPWQKRMIPTKAEDGSPKKDATVTHRDYLADSVFGAVLSGDDALVDEMATGLADPVWGVWLGTFLGQTVQALMLYSFIRRPEKEISNYEIRVMSLTFHRTRTWRSPISHRRR